MADSKNDSVTKADFQLLKQEMKHDYSLFVNNVSNRIDEKLNKMAKVVIGFVTIFIVAFWTYFEFTSDKVDQLSLARLASMDERLVRMETIEAGLLAIFQEAGIITDKKKDIKKYNPASDLNPNTQTGEQKKVKKRKK